MSEVRSLQRFHSLSAEQVEVLDQVLSEVVPIHGRGNFPTLELRPRDIIAAVRSRLQSQGIMVRDVRLNGSTASHVLVRDNGTNYKDLDIIFGVDLPRQEDFQVIKESVLACLLDCLPAGVNKERISSSTMKEAYVQKMVKVFTEQDRWSLISLSNNSGKNLELKFVSALRRQFEFSVDSFQIILDRMLESYLQAEESQRAANKLGREGCGLANHSKKAMPLPAPASTVDILVKSETVGSSDKRTASDEMAQLDRTEPLYETKSSDHNANSDKKTLSDEKELAELPLQMASADQRELSDRTEQTGNSEEAHHCDETDPPDTKETSDQKDASDTTEHTGSMELFKPEQTGLSDCVKLPEPTEHLEPTRDSDPTKQSDWTEPSVKTEPTHGEEHSEKTGSNESFSKSEIHINSGTQTEKDKHKQPEKTDKKTEIQQDTDTSSKSMTDYIPATDTSLSVSLISCTPSDDNTQPTEAQHTLKTQNTEHMQDSNPTSNTALQHSENAVNTVNTADTQGMPQAEPSRMADRNSPSPPLSKAPTRLSLMVVLKHSSPKPPRRMCRKVSPIPNSAPDPDLSLTLDQRTASRPEDNEETGPGTEASSGPTIAHSSKHVIAPCAEPNIDPSPEPDLEPIIASSPAAYEEHTVPCIPKPNPEPFIAPIEEPNPELFFAPIQEPDPEPIIGSSPEPNPEPIMPPILEPNSDLSIASSSEPRPEPIITNSSEPITPPIPEPKPELIIASSLEPTPVSIIPPILEPKPEPIIPPIPELNPEPIIVPGTEPIIPHISEPNTDLIIAPSPKLDPEPIINLSPVSAPEHIIAPSPKPKPALIIALTSPEPEISLSSATSTEATTSPCTGSSLEPMRASEQETSLETQTISGPDPIPESETLPTTQPDIIPSLVIVSSVGCNQTEGLTTPPNADHILTYNHTLPSSVSISANPDTAHELGSDSTTDAWSTPPHEQPGSPLPTEAEVAGPALTDTPSVSVVDETPAEAPEDPGSPQEEPELSDSPDQLVSRPRTLALHSHALPPRSEAELTEGDHQTDQHTVEQSLSTQHRSPAISGLAPPTLSISPHPLCFPPSPSLSPPPCLTPPMLSLSPPPSYSPPPLSFSPPSSCLSSPPYLTPPMLSLSPPPCHSPPSPCLTPPLLCLTPPVESEQPVAQVYLDSEPLTQNTVIEDQVAQPRLQLPVPHLRNKELPLSPQSGPMAQSPASEPVPLSQLRQKHDSAPPQDSKPINPAPESREAPRVPVDTSEQSKAPTQTSSRVPAVEVLAESMYGDFEAAMDHLRYRLIATRNPEEIRGGGLLKYSNLLVRDYRPASETQIKTLERYMCSRFFIDFPDVQEQQRKILSYLKNHFIGEERSKYQYLMTLRRVVDDSTVCLMGHERRQTLNMITVLALRVLGEQNIIPNTDHVTCYYQPAPYLAEHSAPFMAEASYCSYYIPQGGSTLLYQPYPLHLHTQTGLV